MVATTGNATTKDVEYPEVIVKERVITTRHDYQACALIPTRTPLPRTFEYPEGKKSNDSASRLPSVRDDSNRNVTTKDVGYPEGRSNEGASRLTVRDDSNNRNATTKDVWIS